MIPLLLYHSVASDPSRRFAPWAVAPDRFEAQITRLADEGYTTVTVAELVRRVYERAEPLPPRSLVITFDDGFADFHGAAWPVLDRHGFTATVFVTTGYIGRTAGWLARLGEGNRPLMNAAQLAEIATAGIECGAHSVTHAQLDAVPHARARREIAASKQALEAIVGPVQSFAYPHGYHSQTVRGYVRAAGFSGACACGDGAAGPAGDRWAIPRLTVRREMTVDALLRALERTHEGSTGRPLRGAWRLLRRAGAARVIG